MNKRQRIKYKTNAENSRIPADSRALIPVIFGFVLKEQFSGAHPWGATRANCFPNDDYNP